LSCTKQTRALAVRHQLKTSIQQHRGRRRIAEFCFGGFSADENSAANRPTACGGLFVLQYNQSQQKKPPAFRQEGRRHQQSAKSRSGTKPLSLTVSGIFNGECDAVVDMTLNDLQTKVKVINFGINRFLILYAANSNFCSMTHRLATVG